MQSTDQPRLVSIGSAAEQLKVSQSVLRKWERLGLIDAPARVGGDNRRCYTEGQIEALRTFADGRRQWQRQPATEPVRA